MYSDINIGNGLRLKPVNSLGPKQTDMVIDIFCKIVRRRRPNADLCAMEDSPSRSITYAVFYHRKILGVMSLYDMERADGGFTAKPMPIFHAPDDRGDIGRAALWGEVMHWFLVNGVPVEGRRNRKLLAFVLPIDNVEHRWTTRSGDATNSVLATLVNLGASITYVRRGRERIPIEITV